MARGAGAELTAGAPTPRDVRPGSADSTEALALEAERRSPSPGRQDWRAVALLVLLGVALPATVAAGAHSSSVPFNDDWAYRRVLDALTGAGHLSFAGWGTMTLVGQVLWAAPFVWALGSHPWVPALSVAVLSGAGLAAAYWLARSFLDRRQAVLSCLVLLLLPGFALSTSSFMTDVPAFAAAMGCLALGAVALRRERRSQWAWIIGCLAAGAFGFSIRQFDLAAPVAVLVVLAGGDRRHWPRYLLACGGLALVCGLTYWWSSHLPGAQHKGVGPPSLASLRSLAQGFFTLALFVSPFLPQALRRRGRPSRLGAVAGATIAAGAGTWLFAAHQGVFLGNYLTRSGMLGATVLTGYRPGLFPKPLWAGLEVLAIVAGVALAFVASGVPRPRHFPRPQPRPERLVRAYLTLTAAGLLVYALFVRAPVFDRYLWPVAFMTVLLFSSHREARSGGRGSWREAPLPRWLSLGLTLALFATTSALTLNTYAFDSARWRAGQDAVAMGYPAAMVDAGFEWVGAHQHGVAVPNHARESVPPFETWYDEMFPGFRDCAVVSGSLLQGGALVLLGRATYDELLVAVPEHLYLYGFRTGTCPSRLSSKSGRG